MKIDIENQTFEIDDNLVEKYNKCMERCNEQKSKTIIISTPTGESKLYNLFQKHIKAKDES